MALGAKRNDVRTMVIGQGLRVALAGLLVGLAGAFASGRALSGLLYGVSPYDPVLLLTAGIVLLLVAVVASYAPARRATAVDPVTALNSQ
jgi:ABC-type antimicrobial peptide transport system permease subunit